MGQAAAVDDVESAEVFKEAETLFHSLVHEAINLPGDHTTAGASTNFTEAEVQQLREGRTFFHGNLWFILWTIGLTEVLEFSIQRVTSFFLRNENYNRPNFIVFRAVGLAMHVLRWFGEGIEKREAESAKDLHVVRKIHAAALRRLGGLPAPPPNEPRQDRTPLLEAIREDLAHIPSPDFLPTIMTQNPTVPLSQFDMALVLGSSYFLLDANPTSIGFSAEKREGYESYVYYIGIIGRYLGLEDRFNPALHPDPAVRRAVSARFWERVIAPCFKEFKEPEFLNMCYFTENGCYSFVNPVAVAVHLVIKDVLGARPATRTWVHVNWVNRLVYRCLRVAFVLVQFSPLLYLGNIAVRVLLWVSWWLLPAAERKRLSY